MGPPEMGREKGTSERDLARISGLEKKLTFTWFKLGLASMVSYGSLQVPCLWQDDASLCYHCLVLVSDDIDPAERAALHDQTKLHDYMSCIVAAITFA